MYSGELGSIGVFARPGADVLTLFHEPVHIPDGTVLDPFMGSGAMPADTANLEPRLLVVTPIRLLTSS